MKCPDCGVEYESKIGEWDYTTDVGLLPDEYTCVLSGVEVLTCQCGSTAAIPAMRPQSR